MSGNASRLILLGSRHEGPELSDVLRDLGVDGRVALISAGWQEWEQDDEDARDRLGAMVNLDLYGRAERVWHDDPDLAGAHRALGERIRGLRRAYNVRLAPTMDAWLSLEAMHGDDAVLGPEREDALEAVRSLDRHHLARMTEVRADFNDRWRPQDRAAVRSERQEVERILADSAAVVVEGGHVPVLLNRLRLFGITDLLDRKTVVARSGGAMVLGTRVVFFHDSPPWGPGHSEIGEVGLGLYDGVVSLPLAARRLRLDDPGRVSRLARRFAPDTCLLLEAGTRAVLKGGHWTMEHARRLSASGAPEGWRGAA